MALAIGVFPIMVKNNRVVIKKSIDDSVAEFDLLLDDLEVIPIFASNLSFRAFAYKDSFSAAFFKARLIIKLIINAPQTHYLY